VQIYGFFLNGQDGFPEKLVVDLSLYEFLAQKFIRELALEKLLVGSCGEFRVEIAYPLPDMLEENEENLLLPVDSLELFKHFR
jgi:hypothetical protein